MHALMVIAPVDFRDEEFQVPYEMLKKAGVEVTVASTQAGTCQGMLGMTYEPDTTVDDVDADEFDAIIVVGGRGSPQHLWNNESLLEIIAEAVKKDKVVAGICLSGAVLANAGVLEGKNATVFSTPDSLAALRKGGAHYLQEDVVVDGRIVTAIGPHAASEFGKSILWVLGV